MSETSRTNLLTQLDGELTERRYERSVMRAQPLSTRSHKPKDTRGARIDFRPKLLTEESSDKKSFLIKRSTSATRSVLDVDQRTVELNRKPTKVLDKPGTSSEYRLRTMEDTHSARTVTTMNEKYNKALPNLASGTNIAYTQALTKMKRKQTIQASNYEASTKLFEKIQSKVSIKIKDKDSKLDQRFRGGIRLSKPEEEDELPDIPLPRKQSSRRFGIKGFCFKKKVINKKWHITMALQDQLKQIYINYRDQFSHDLFILHRSLILICGNRQRELDIVLQQDRLFQKVQYAEIDPADLSYEAQNRKNEQENMYDQNENADDSSGEEKYLDPDYKTFDYVRNYQSMPKCTAAVFTNLEEAIFGHIQLWLTRRMWDIDVADAYLKSVSPEKLTSNLSVNLDKKILIKTSGERIFIPIPLEKRDEYYLLLRNNTLKRYQASYIEESGRIMNDSSENITLWGFQINKLLNKDPNELLGEIPNEIPPLELRKLNTKLIKQVFKGLEEEAEQDVVLLLQAYEKKKKSISHLHPNASPQMEPRNIESAHLPSHNSHSHPHTSSISKSDLMHRFAKLSMEENYEFWVDRFFQAHDYLLRLPWVKTREVFKPPECSSPSCAERSLTNDKLFYSPRKVPAIKINMISTDNIPRDDSDSLQKISGIGTPSNAGRLEVQSGSFILKQCRSTPSY